MVLGPNIRSQFRTTRINPDLLLGFPNSYQDSRIPKLLNQDSLYEIVVNTSIQLSIYFDKINTLHKENRQNRQLSGESEDSNFSDDGWSIVDDTPSILLKPEDVYDFIH